jgi:hypothetical protein
MPWSRRPLVMMALGPYTAQSQSEAGPDRSASDVRFVCKAWKIAFFFFFLQTLQFKREAQWLGLQYIAAKGKPELGGGGQVTDKRRSCRLRLRVKHTHTPTAAAATTWKTVC